MWSFIVFLTLLAILITTIGTIFFAIKRSSKWKRWLVCLGAFLVLCVAGSVIASHQEKKLTTSVQNSNNKLSYELIDKKPLNAALVLEVRTDQMDTINEISNELVAKYKKENNFMIRIFFYVPGQTPGTSDLPKHRITWTPSEGFKQDF